MSINRHALRLTWQNLLSQVQTHFPWIIPILFGVLLCYWNPFGIINAMDQRSEEAFIQFQSPLYESKGYDDIVMVLLDDEFLRQNGASYPPERYVYLAPLSQIINSEPRAIFVDIFFSEDRGDEEQTRMLGEFLRENVRNPACRADTITQAQGCRAVENSEPRSKLPYLWVSDLRRWLTNNEGLRKSALANPETAGKLYIDSPEKYDFFGNLQTLTVTRTLPDGAVSLCVDAFGNPTACEDTVSGLASSYMASYPAPAYEIYKLWCEQWADEACRLKTPRLPMTLMWSRKPEPSRDEYGEGADLSECSVHYNDGLQNLLLSLKLFFRGFTQSYETSKYRQRCYPFQTVLASDLDRLSSNANEMLFKNRIVFFGAMFSANPDLITSPVHGQLPAVFSHAMALDNLITYDNSYWRRTSDFGNNSLDVIGFLLISAISLFATTRRHKLKNSANREQSRLDAYSEWALRDGSLILTEPIHSSDRSAKSLMESVRACIWSALGWGTVILIALIVAGILIPMFARILPANYFGHIQLAFAAIAGPLYLSVRDWTIASSEYGLIGNLLSGDARDTVK